ncbi:PREDICTED: transmembrane emp24 domain-containing protein p24delta3-like [Tarenaya hassleriana]|uniref:transmembrane emp24 domain-containing protein p24delta3-like n=1 Tax=Tarenaya hassleriana TaxID=28532 RepID=UPI00053C7263|nr:PREDICTED: transmembrane emp24 domain-containing protein p24delta3-like [Tarenaya hassleriana]
MLKLTSQMRCGFPLAIVLSALLLFMSPEIIPVGEAIWMSVPPTGTKCVSEEIQSNVVVLADFLVISEDHSVLPTVSVKVTSPYGNNLHHQENIAHGQFAFTTQESGNYLACFWAEGHNHGNKDISINLDWKTGIAAKDWDSIAKKEKIEGVELELRKLEGAVEAIHENLLYLKTREAEMRTVSEKTNSRVAWFSIMSLGICIAVSGLQVVYLKQYFQKKKLI